MSSINPLQLNQPPFQSNQSSSSSAIPQSCHPNESKGKSKLNRPRPILLPELLTQDLAQSDDSTSLEDSKKIFCRESSHYSNLAKTELRQPPPSSPRSPKPTEENQKLRRELSVSLTARKSLEKMFSSLGREKEMIASELARKVQELNYMEELVNDLRADNKMLSEKVKVWREVGSATEMEERIRELSEKLLKALDGYKMAKRRLKEVKEENERVKAEVLVVVERMRRVKERRGEGVEEEEMGELEKVLEKLAKVGLPPSSN